mgnify:CR=1 FL=1
MIGLASSFFAAAPVAFAAGLISFLSPCVLPLLPGYLGFLGGVLGQESGQRHRGRAVLGALALSLVALPRAGGAVCTATATA